MSEAKRDNRTLVHAGHCCARHGCKYGDEACPVVSGQVVQDHPCEQCGDDPEDPGAARYAVLRRGVWVDGDGTGRTGGGMLTYLEGEDLDRYIDGLRNGQADRP